jgi:hypothetical protein
MEVIRGEDEPKDLDVVKSGSPRKCPSDELVRPE